MNNQCERVVCILDIKKLKDAIVESVPSSTLRPACRRCHSGRRRTGRKTATHRVEFAVHLLTLVEFLFQRKPLRLGHCSGPNELPENFQSNGWG